MNCAALWKGPLDNVMDSLEELESYLRSHGCELIYQRSGRQRLRIIEADLDDREARE